MRGDKFLSDFRLEHQGIRSPRHGQLPRWKVTELEFWSKGPLDAGRCAP